MSDRDPQSKREIIEQAAAWYARMSADDVTLQDCRELEAWLEQGPEYREVFEHTELTLGRLRSLADDPRLKALSTTDEVTSSYPSQSRRAWSFGPRQLALAAAALVALVVPLLYFMGSERIPESTNYETAVAERQTIDLADGSTLTLNAGTSITVTLAEDERQVALWRGDMFVSVASDADRPFSVNVGEHRVIVTGTSFDIRFRDNAPRVTVHEGNVRVALAVDGDAGANNEIEMRAGEQLVLEAGATPAALSDEELSRLSDWRNGWLHLENATLGQLVNELEPYTDIPILLTSRRVMNLEIGGSFNVDKVDTILINLETLLPVQIVRETDRILIRHESDAATP